MVRNGVFDGDAINEMLSASEWKTDEYGKKYRMIGNVKEYMPTITIDGVEIENTPEAVEAFNARRKKATSDHYTQEFKRQQEVKTGRFCPFGKDGQVMRECKKDCALYAGDSCSLTASAAVRDTKGAPCPFMRWCVPSCAAYNAGCTLNDKRKRV